jgi:signal transduction histidine kinase
VRGVRGATVRAVRRLELLARRHFFDAAIVIVAAVAQFEIWSEPTWPRWQLSLGAAAATLPLLLRRRYGIVTAFVPLVVVSFLAVQYGTEVYESGTMFVVVLLVAAAAGHLRDRRQALAGLVALIVTANVATASFPDQELTEYVWVTSFFVGVWLASFVLAQRGRQAREALARARILDLEREAEARTAVAEERARIARELHDVVAHSVSVMTVQAAGVRRLLRPEQEREREALETIEQTGREALAEMRRMLGVLRQPTEEPPALAPQPGLASLESLIEHVREAGLPVELHISGERPELPAGIDLNAYRVVQEALTNALRHAGPARARVDVRYAPDAVELEIANDGRSDVTANGDGQGLVGMRERVMLCGGTVESGPLEGGGYAVRARLLLEEKGSAG